MTDCTQKSCKPVSTSALEGDEKSNVAVAPAPFNNWKKTADVVLRTPDSVHFYVHRLILSMASPVFADTFDIAHPDEIESSPHGALPVVQVAESSQVLSGLLRLSYPGCQEPVLENLKDVDAMYDSARKYDMEQVYPALRRLISSFVPRNPVKVFSVASRYRLNDQAKEAALAWREKTLWQSNPRLNSAREWASELQDDFKSVLGDITAGTFFKLVQFAMSGVPGEFFEPLHVEKDVLKELDPVHPSPLCAPSFKDPDSDLIVHTSNGVDLFVHKLVLRLASPRFASMIADNEALPSACETLTITVPEDSTIISRLLSLCYPFRDPHVATLPLAIALMDAAIKYELPRAKQYLEKVLEALLHNDPLLVYFKAVEYQLRNLALIAAVHQAVPSPWKYFEQDPTFSHMEYNSLLQTYAPESERVSAHAFTDLMDFMEEALIFHSCIRWSRHKDEGPQAQPCLNLGQGQVEAGAKRDALAEKRRAFRRPGLLMANGDTSAGNKKKPKVEVVESRENVIQTLIIWAQSQ